MARIRSVVPWLRTSLTVADWPRETRYFWVLLWGYLDDHGRGVDEPRLIKADTFPLDDDVTSSVIEEWVTLIASSKDEEAAPLCRYTVAGRRYLHCPNWRKYQKPSHPTDSVIPDCPIHGSSRESRESFRSGSRKPPEGSAKGSPERGDAPASGDEQQNSTSGQSRNDDRLDADDDSQTRRSEAHESFANDSGEIPEGLASVSPLRRETGDGRKKKNTRSTAAPSTTTNAADDPNFTLFWSAYPRKVGKPSGRRAWKSAMKRGADPEAIVAAAQRFRDDPARKPDFTPHPATWLNDERYVVELPDTGTNGSGRGGWWNN